MARVECLRNALLHCPVCARYKGLDSRIRQWLFSGLGYTLYSLSLWGTRVFASIQEALQTISKNQAVVDTMNTPLGAWQELIHKDSTLQFVQNLLAFS